MLAEDGSLWLLRKVLYALNVAPSNPAQAIRELLRINEWRAQALYFIGSISALACRFQT